MAIFEYSGTVGLTFGFNSITDNDVVQDWTYYGRLNINISPVVSQHEDAFRITYYPDDLIVNDFVVERAGEQPQLRISYTRPDDTGQTTALRLVRRAYTYPTNESDGEIVFETTNLGSGVFYYSDLTVDPFIPYFYAMYSEVDGDWITGRDAKANEVAFQGNYFPNKIWSMLPRRVKLKDEDVEYGGAIVKALEQQELLGKTYNVTETGEEKGQLQRFLKIFGVEFDDIKGKIDLILNNLRNPRETTSKFLSCIARLVGLNLNTEFTIDRQRREILDTVALYKRKGTANGFEAAARLVTNLSDVEVLEYTDLLLCSNHDERLSAKMPTMHDFVSRIFRTSSTNRSMFVPEDVTSDISPGDSIEISGASTSGVNGTYTVESVIFRKSYTEIKVEEHISNSFKEGTLYANPYIDLYLGESGEVDEHKIINSRSYSEIFNPWTFEVRLHTTDQNAITQEALRKIERVMNRMSPVCTTGFVSVLAAVLVEELYLNIEEDSVIDDIEEQNVEDMGVHFDSSQYYMYAATSGSVPGFLSNEWTSRSVFSYYVYSFDINSTTHSTKTINVAGDVSSTLDVGDIIEITGATTSGVNGLYTVVSRTFNDPDSDIVVSENIANSTSEGDLTYGDFYSELWWDVFYPRISEEAGFVQTVPNLGVT